MCIDEKSMTLFYYAKDCKDCKNWNHGTFVFGQTESGKMNWIQDSGGLYANKLLCLAVASIFASLFSFFGFGLNLVVIVALLYSKKTRNHVTTPFIVSLSCLDLIYSGYILPIFAVRFGKR